MKKSMLLAIITLLGLIAFALPAESSTLTFDYIQPLNGWMRPTTSPRLTATFADDIPNNRVILTLSTPGISGTEQIVSWYFNFNPNKSLSLNLQFDGVNSTGPSAQTLILEDYHGDTGGAGGFDIEFTFLDEYNPFGPGKTTIYWITSDTIPVRASDFNFGSELSGICSDCGYKSVAHIQGIPAHAAGGKVKITDNWVVPVGADYRREISRLHAIDLNVAAINKRLVQLNEFEALPQGATNSLKAMANQLQGLQAKLEEVVAVLPTPSPDSPYIGQDEAVFLLDSIRVRSKNVYGTVEKIADRMGVGPSPFLPLFHNVLSIGIIEGINFHLSPVLPILPPPPLLQFP